MLALLLSAIKRPKVTYTTIIDQQKAGDDFRSTAWGRTSSSGGNLLSLRLTELTVYHKGNITSAITLNTTAAGVLPLTGCHKQLNTNAYYSCHNISHRRGGATLVHSWQPVTSYQTNHGISQLIQKFRHVPSMSISERLPQIAHFNIFVLAHKNADEPVWSSATLAELRQHLC
jgi:hypothetical protein